MGGRSLITAEVSTNDAGELVITCVCDCATVTDIVFVVPTIGMTDGEFAYTCEGCQTSHWITAVRIEANRG